MRIETYGTKNIGLRLINGLGSIFIKRKGYKVIKERIPLSGLDLSDEEC